MAYDLGIDVGTTYTCAALVRDGHAEVLQLGTSSQFVPSVITLRDDGDVLWGEAAERRAVTDPTRTITQFKRRFGDEIPYVIGGAPYGAEVLTARLVERVLAQIVELQGEPPRLVALTHPASWREHKLGLLQNAAEMVGLVDVMLVAEPIAAAITYSEREAVQPGGAVLVYDLGGGTFDAAVVRFDADGPQVIGTPEGIEQLGGVDFDQAVLAHVDGALDGELERLDRTDPDVAGALAHLRSECRQAKEALSADTEAEIPVLLPDARTTVRLTRGELEGMVAARLNDTIAVAKRAVSSAQLSLDDIELVLLVGGSSRIPLVAETVRKETGRPVALAPHAKACVAIGAALLASRADAPAPPPIPPPPPPPEPPPPSKKESTPQPRSRRVPIAIAGAAAVALLGVTVALVAGGGSDETAAQPLRLACASELGSVCAAIDESNDIEVTTEPASVTARTIGDAHAASKSAPYDGWLAPSPAAAQMQAAGGVDSATPPLGRTPLAIAIWNDRANVLARRCGTTVTWKCIGENAGTPWNLLGGRAEWGVLKPGQPDPPTTATGSDTLGSQAVSYFGRSDISRTDLERDDFLAWFTPLQRAMRSASGTSAFERMLAAGPAAFDLVGTTEAEAAPRLARDQDKRVKLVYPDSPSVIDAVYAPVTGAKHGPALQSILVGDVGKRALARAGWRVPGHRSARGISETPALPAQSNLPDPGVLAALVETWSGVTG